MKVFPQSQFNLELFAFSFQITERINDVNGKSDLDNVFMSDHISKVVYTGSSLSCCVCYRCQVIKVSQLSLMGTIFSNGKEQFMVLKKR